jgi:hypothetical protein
MDTLFTDAIKLKFNVFQPSKSKRAKLIIYMYTKKTIDKIDVNN